MQGNLSCHEKAQLTYEMLKKRKADKERHKDEAYIDVKLKALKRCCWNKYRRH